MTTEGTTVEEVSMMEEEETSRCLRIHVRSYSMFTNRRSLDGWTNARDAAPDCLVCRCC